MTSLNPQHDRVVAVSGAGTGIGQAVATKFGSLGWRVAVGGRRVERLAETASLVEQAGGTCLAHELDVTDPESVERFFSASNAAMAAINSMRLLVVCGSPPFNSFSCSP